MFFASLSLISQKVPSSTAVISAELISMGWSKFCTIAAGTSGFTAATVHGVASVVADQLQNKIKRLLTSAESNDNWLARRGGGWHGAGYSKSSSAHQEVCWCSGYAPGENNECSVEVCTPFPPPPSVPATNATGQYPSASSVRVSRDVRLAAISPSASDSIGSLLAWFLAPPEKHLEQLTMYRFSWEVLFYAGPLAFCLGRDQLSAAEQLSPLPLPPHHPPPHHTTLGRALSLIHTLQTTQYSKIRDGTSPFVSPLYIYLSLTQCHQNHAAYAYSTTPLRLRCTTPRSCSQVRPDTLSERSCDSFPRRNQTQLRKLHVGAHPNHEGCSKKCILYGMNQDEYILNELLLRKNNQN
uniref:Uncharacterized protein n=1 Tax=Timema bartmani TaxID=61472 RepID=A0A7R9HY79_9NEOP|nr:unnamed protein product [Timema bartmani]